MGGHITLVKDCPSKGCFLKPYRMGKNPNSHRPGKASNFRKKPPEPCFLDQGSIENSKAMVGAEGE
jgi:hypothetical protein